MDKKLFFGSTAYDVFERLKFVFNIKTSKELAHKSGMSETGISSAIKRNSIPYNYCAEISKAYGIPLDWLIFGDVDGEQFYRSLESSFFERAYANSDFVNTYNPNKPLTLSNYSVEFIDLYDTTINIESEYDVEDSLGKVPFSKEWLTDEKLDIKELFCLKNKGINMQPDIYDGDIVLVNRAIKRGNGIYVIKSKDGLHIMRLQWLIDGNIRISSNNSFYEPEIVDANKSNRQFKIIGKCHTKLSRFDQ